MFVYKSAQDVSSNSIIVFIFSDVIGERNQKIFSIHSDLFIYYRKKRILQGKEYDLTMSITNIYIFRYIILLLSLP